MPAERKIGRAGVKTGRAKEPGNEQWSERKMGEGANRSTDPGRSARLLGNPVVPGLRQGCG